MSHPFSWSSLFSNSRVAFQDTRLEQFKIYEVDGISDVSLDLIMRGEIVWREYLVGFFLEQRLGFPYVKSDRPTKEQRRLDYARVCVEYKVNEILPDSFEIQLSLNNRNAREQHSKTKAKEQPALIYDGNGPGEDVTRRIWILSKQLNPGNIQSSAGDGTSCRQQDHSDIDTDGHVDSRMVVYREGNEDPMGSRFAILNVLDRLDSLNDLVDVQEVAESRDESVNCQEVADFGNGLVNAQEVADFEEAF
ncbi:hypothetical protein IFM89_009695 [Coptis chinensis]|uniref:Uncharacterized protein n=1 Tax=Coptis chinensis TaxID=261450 RepID=A0A835HUX0_9MAGN|nr:hypothetical protein IFM89_009695 [Coptis chinensis]